jgi:hypothetical protein
VAQRQGPTAYNQIGGLQTFSAIASWTQILTPTLAATAAYELGIIGFGSSLGSITGQPNIHTGYQGNPYRSVNLGGAPSREVVPFQRIRQSASLSASWLVTVPSRLVPYIVLKPGYRLYWDDWGLISNTPELRLHVPVGPLELRLTGRLHTQNSASFSSEQSGKPSYPNSMGKPCRTCLSSASRGYFFTSDPKLYRFDSFLLELRLLIHLGGLAGFRRLPLHTWLAAGTVELSYGHYFDDKFAHAAFGDADIAGLSLAFPL